MNTSASKRNSTGSTNASETVSTRRGHLPGPESGFGKRLRKARGIQTQAEVSERAEIARSAYARYETGGRYPSVPELRRLCDALSVTPEYLIFGESGPGFTPSSTPLTKIAPEGDSEKAKMTRHVLTSVLLNTLPKNETDAFRELIWAAAAKHLGDQPEALSLITQMCNLMMERIWTEMDALVEHKFESDPKIKEFVDSLSDNEDSDS